MYERAESHEWMRLIFHAWRRERSHTREVYGPLTRPETRKRREYEEDVYAREDAMRYWYRNHELKWAAVQADAQTEEERWATRVREYRRYGQSAQERWADVIALTVNSCHKAGSSHGKNI